MRATASVSLVEFKATATRRLPAGHPLLRILARVPDQLPPADLAARLGDWVALLEDSR